MRHGFLLRRLFVALEPTATVAQVNAAGRTVGALAITSAEPGSLLLLIEVPRQSDVAALQNLATQLRNQPGIAFAWPAEVARTSVLPEFSPGVPVATDGLGHLLANRFPQAWNARTAAPSDCLPRAVSVYVWDEFGDLNARPHFFLQVDASSFIGDPQGPGPGTGGHGYDVTATLAGRFDADTPTGANGFADCLLIHQQEADGVAYLASMRRVMAALAADAEPRIILTASLNFNDDGFCGPASDQACTLETARATPAETLRGAIVARVLLAGEWALLYKAAGLEQKVLITQSAGNVDDAPAGFLATNYLGFRTAGLASAPALATRLGALVGLLTDTGLWTGSTDSSLPAFAFDTTTAAQVVQGSPALAPDNATSPDNLLLVDSGTKGETIDDIGQSFFDFLGADVRAVGEGVVLDGREANGTSFSAPAVAGLAAYLWNLAPTLLIQPASATADLVRRTSRTTANSPSVPVVDAYAAVLNLDNLPGCCGLHPGGQVRFGLLDANGDGGFTGIDLQKFAAAYSLGNPDTPTVPTNRDYSRFDLNGDGFTGGILIAPFDLDPATASAQPVISTASEQIEDYDISFSEAALSDIQILCYYAYSPLYASDGGGQNDQLRTDLLGADHCVNARINAQLPAQFSSATSLTVGVEVPSTAGQFVPAGDLLVEFTPTCATVSPGSGRTDGNGAITTTVTPIAGCTTASVAVVARANAGTTPLASTTISASVSTARVFSGNLTDTFHRELADPSQGYSLTEDLTISAFVRVSLPRPDGGALTFVSAGGTITRRAQESSLVGCSDGSGGLVPTTFTTTDALDLTISGGEVDSLKRLTLFGSGTDSGTSSGGCDQAGSFTIPVNGQGYGPYLPAKLNLDGNGNVVSVDLSFSTTTQLDNGQSTRIVTGLLVLEP